MEDRIEDRIFEEALKAQNIHLTKSMYEKAEYPHACSMCNAEVAQQFFDTYRLKVKYIRDYEQPYIFICTECYNELPDE